MKRTPLNKTSKNKAKEKRQEGLIRAELLALSNGRCMECGELLDFRGLSLHHKTFKSQGGRSTKENCILICG